MSDRDVVHAVYSDLPELNGLESEVGTTSGLSLRVDHSYKPTRRAFKPMVEEQRFDICEMAVGTYIQARDAGRPITLLPISMLSRFQHHRLQVPRTSRVEDPSLLTGESVGVRAYSQTTGLWARAFLHRQYGVSAAAVRWVTFEEPHVSGTVQPDNVNRAPDGADLVEMTADEDLSAAIVGTGVRDERLRPLLASPGASAHAWYDLTGVVPVNHVLTVTEERLRASPDFVQTIYDALSVRSRARTGSNQAPRDQPGDQWRWSAEVDMYPLGSDLLRVVNLAAEECLAQGLVRRDLSEDDLIDPLVRTWL